MLARKTPCCARLRSNPTGSMLACSHQAQKAPIACASRTALYAAPSPPRGLGSDHIIILKTKKTLCSVFFVFRAGKGNTRLRALATRAEASPYGLEACATSAEIFQLCSRCSHVKNFSRTLFSIPSSFLSQHKKRKTTLKGGFSFLEREKGLGPSTPTLARSCSTN